MSQKTLEEIEASGITIGEYLKKFKQPDWCAYPDALAGMMGCWSLVDNRPNGLRTKISRKFCKGCDCYVNK